MNPLAAGKTIESSCGSECHATGVRESEWDWQSVRMLLGYR